LHNYQSYSFNGVQTNKVYRVPNTGRTKIKAFYLGQEEEVIYTSYDMKRIQHILKRESESNDFTASKILTVYIQYPYIYIKIHVPYPMFTVTREMEYYYNQYNESFFNGQIMTDVTAEVNSGAISLPNNIAIEMIRTHGDNTQRPTYGNIPSGTMYFDDYIQKPLWWDGEKWIDKDGNDASNFIAFTIDGVTCIGIRNETFASWIKSPRNTLRIRLADDGNDPLVVTADGNKTLYVNYNGSDTSIRESYGVMELKSGGAYFFKDTPGANPDYSKVPVFWNGTELVTTPIYNGEVE